MASEKKAKEIKCWNYKYQHTKNSKRVQKCSRVVLTLRLFDSVA